MVKTYKKATAGGSLVIIAMLLVSTIPLNLGPAAITLPELDPSNVFTNKSTVKQGEEVIIQLSDKILSDDVGIFYFFFDFHDPLDPTVQVIDRTTESDRSVSHTYYKVGRYDVSVMAMRGNLTKVFNVPITVVPEPLLIDLTAQKSSFQEDEPVNFEAVIGNTIASVATDYFWEFGDGASTKTNRPSVQHSYNNSGFYTPKIRVYTNDTMMYTAFMDITIINNVADVTIEAVNSDFEDNEVEFFARINNIDSDFNSLEYVWSFDDGTFGFGDKVNHRFYESKEYNVKVSVYDDDGFVGVDFHSLVIQNVNPTISLHNDILAFYEGETAITTATVFDTPSDYPNLRYDWNTDSEGLQASIPMLDDGIYRFNATVTDDDGLEASASTQLINILNVAPIVSLISAYSTYNISFSIYGTIGTEVNMTLFKDNVPVMNGSMTSFSTSINEKNTTTFGSYTQDLLEYYDILYYVNNQTNSYDNYVITTFSFADAEDFTLINHCQGGNPCSPLTWRESITPLDKGFPVTMNFQYFDPGNDNITIGVDFGSATYESIIPKEGTANMGVGTVRGALPYGQNPTSIRYWGMDDEGGRREHALALINYATLPNPSGYLNITSWARSGHVLSHYAPGALISLTPNSASGSLNKTFADNELWEGTAAQFYADAAYITPNALNYEWHMGDGSPNIYLKSPIHTYKYSGTYLVWVKISDGFYESVAYSWMTVNNHIQTIEPMIVGSLEEGQELKFSVSGLNDILQFSSNYTFIWDFGDGRFEYGEEVWHTYESAGSFSLTLSVLDEHHFLDTQGLKIPIRPRAPFVYTPLQTELSVIEGENLQFHPLVTDSSYDRIDLIYQWTVGGKSYNTSSINLQYPAGFYSGLLNVIDNDGAIFSHQFNFTVMEIPVVLSLADAQLYGRSINKSIRIQGTLSPNVFTWDTYTTSYNVIWKLFAKNGSLLNEGPGLFLDNFMYELNISLSGIYDANKLQEVKTDTRPILTILRELPTITSGDYSIQVELQDANNTTIGMEDAIIHYVADQDNDIIQDELEIVFGDRIDGLELDPLEEDTNDNGISDSIDFLIADDPDRDGLPGLLENEWGTDPNDPDTDDDGLQDGWGKNGLGEITHKTNPLNPDSDGDGINDFNEVVGWEIEIEYNFGYRLREIVTSNPNSDDTDSDGVTDYFELSLGSNPRNPDSDLDGLNDVDEKERGTKLYTLDSDRDGLTDGVEVHSVFTTFIYILDGLNLDYIARSYTTNPLSNDTDKDGVSDYDEVMVYKSVATTADSDQDGVSDYNEVGNGTNLIHADTDGDGLGDGIELAGFEIPYFSLTPGSYAEDGTILESPTKSEKTILVYTNPLLEDSDGDGISDFDELVRGDKSISNPTLADSDLDGLPDLSDPYPLIPDYAPPSFSSIEVEYDVGDNSITSNVMKYFAASAQAILNLLKDVGQLFLDILNSIFYMKCVEKIAGKCIYLPWIRSASEIAYKLKTALFKFATSSDENMAQIFPGYSAADNIVSKIISFDNFGFDLTTNSAGIPTDISVNGLMNLAATTGTKILEQLVDPTVTVRLQGSDEIGISKIDVFKDDDYVKTVYVNSKFFYLREEFSVIPNADGSTSSTFKFIVYDFAGNSIQVEKTTSVADFVENIANDSFKTIIDVVSVFAPWSRDILTATVTAVVDAAIAVAEFALDILLFVIQFVTEAIPALFEAFVHETIGKYLEKKSQQAESLFDDLMKKYGETRDTVISELESAQTSLNIDATVSSGVSTIQDLMNEFLPPLNEKAFLKELTGSSDFFVLTDLDGTIFGFVVEYMKDEFTELFTEIINDYVNEIIESQVEQYLGPMGDLYTYIQALFDELDIDLGLDDSIADISTINVGTVEQGPQKLLEFFKSITDLLTSLPAILDSISAEQAIKVVDLFMIQNPNIAYSLNDLMRSFVKPIFMFGIVIYDVISTIGSLVSPLSLNNLDDILTKLFHASEKFTLKTQAIQLDASTIAKIYIVVKIVWKAAEFSLDFALNLYLGNEKFRQQTISLSTSHINYGFRLMMFGLSLILDIGVDLSLGKDIRGEALDGNFHSSLVLYITKAVSFYAKGVFLAIATRSPNSIFNEVNYDWFATIIDAIVSLVELVTTILENIPNNSSFGSELDLWILSLVIITTTVGLIFIVANWATYTSFKYSGPQQIAYLGVYAANYVLKWVVELLRGIQAYNE